MFATAGAAFAAFCATSVDELLVLVAAFSKAALPNASITATDIFIGTLLGTSCVLALSALGLAGVLLPSRYVKLLGFVPLLMGLRQLARRFAKWRRRRREREAPQQGVEAPLLEPEPAAPAVEPSPPLPPWGAAALGVTAVVVAGGAEEVAVYLPLLASDPENVVAVVGVVLGMTVLWLGAAAAFVSCGAVAKAVEVVGEAAEPWLFVAIGVYCLVGSAAIPVQL